MTWFWLALVGHIANGIAFVIDKILLKTAFKRSATYAGLVGIQSVVALLAIPFVSVWPTLGVWSIAMISGATFVLALWAFFAALSRAEASRIVPIVGSLIPILTLVGTFVFLGERLSDATFMGFGLLIVATIILSGGGKGRPSKDAVWLAVTSAFLFAVASVTGKASYDGSSFLGGLVTSRIAAALTAFLLLALIDRKAGREALSIIKPQSKKKTKAAQKTGAAAALLAIVGQAVGSLGFILVQWGVAQGSASIVNAMQAVQYALLVIAAFALRKKAPHLLGENLTPQVIAIKTGALVIAAVGMYLVVS